MSFADVLVRVVPRDADELERLAVAVDLSQRFRARLDGVFLTGIGGNKADWARSLFERAAARSSVETTWRVLEGDTAMALSFQARRSDLAILPCSSTSDSVDGCAPELVALNSGSPVLILPAPAAPMSIGHVILVGWNDTRESARAIHDAMPILVDADKVFVLTVTTEDAPESLADRRLVEHLRQHGVVTELRKRRGDAGEEIAAEARQLNVDMLVIGLRGNMSDQNVTLGDVSRRYIRTASLPVFCSH